MSTSRIAFLTDTATVFEVDLPPNSSSDRVGWSTWQADGREFVIEFSSRTVDASIAEGAFAHLYELRDPSSNARISVVARPESPATHVAIWDLASWTVQVCTDEENSLAFLETILRGLAVADGADSPVAEARTDSIGPMGLLDRDKVDTAVYHADPPGEGDWRAIWFSPSGGRAGDGLLTLGDELTAYVHTADGLRVNVFGVGAEATVLESLAAEIGRSVRLVDARS